LSPRSLACPRGSSACRRPARSRLPGARAAAPPASPAAARPLRRGTASRHRPARSGRAGVAARR